MSSLPAPRLCTLIKDRDSEQGYGFSLCKKRNASGQYIGAVDPGSPAQLAGLKEGDRLVEVNDVNIQHENHRQVVNRIKEIPGEVSLLVVDSACEGYCNENKIKITKFLPNVLSLSSGKGNQNEKKNLDKVGKGISIIGGGVAYSKDGTLSSNSSASSQEV